MLLTDPSNGENSTRGENDSRTEDDFCHENAFGMVTQRPVTEVGSDLLRLVEPIVNRQVIFDSAAPFLQARERVMIRM
jgi:hypothetical protein